MFAEMAPSLSGELRDEIASATAAGLPPLFFPLGRTFGFLDQTLVPLSAEWKTEHGILREHGAEGPQHVGDGLDFTDCAPPFPRMRGGEITRDPS